MTVWTEELIEKNIFELREKLHIEGDRMPTHQEMKDNKLSGLGAAISKNGGIDFWSKKLGLNVITAGEKNTKWTDEAIAEGILSVMDALTLAAITTTINVTIGGNSKYDKYKNKWELIGRLLTGIDEALAI